MANGEDNGDDLAVSITWTGETVVPAPTRSGPPARAARTERGAESGPAAPPDAAGGGPAAAAKPPAITPANVLIAVERVGAHLLALGRLLERQPNEAAPAELHERLSTLEKRMEKRDRSLAARLDHIDEQLQRQAQRRSGSSETTAVDETLFSVLEHLNTLSALVTATSQASSAELSALEARMSRTLSGAAPRVEGRPEPIERESLTDEDIYRIADAVTQSLLDHVRIQTDGLSG